MATFTDPVNSLSYQLVKDSTSSTSRTIGNLNVDGTNLSSQDATTLLSFAQKLAACSSYTLGTNVNLTSRRGIQ